MSDEVVVRLLEEIRDLQRQQVEGQKEIRDLQRQHVENYKDALRNQQESIQMQKDFQRDAVKRLRIVAVLIGLIVAIVMLMPYILRYWMSRGY